MKYIKPQILFGPAGIRSPANEGLKEISKIGLNAAEIEFTYGVNMKNETAKEIGKIAKELNISLSVHAPYYINLASEDKAKIEASKKRILDSCEKGNLLNARYIIFHAAFYQKLEKEECYKIVKEAIIEMQKGILIKGWKDIILCPETTGKGSQFGDIDELTRLSKETGCGICIDFSHIYARQNGKIDYDIVCEKIKSLDAKKITAHFSGINFTEKGERNHIPTEETRAKELLFFLKKYDISIRIINESPIMIEDALMMKKIWGECYFFIVATFINYI